MDESRLMRQLISGASDILIFGGEADFMYCLVYQANYYIKVKIKVKNDQDYLSEPETKNEGHCNQDH